MTERRCDPRMSGEGTKGTWERLEGKTGRNEKWRGKKGDEI